MTVVEKIKSMLLEFFKGDEEKVALWLSSPNPHLGNATPNHMFDIGRAHKVYEFVRAAREENRRD